VTRHAKVIGLGNSWRGDDAAGLIAARRLEAMIGPDVEVVELEGDPTSLIDVWDGADHVVIVDAVRSGAEPGTVHRLDAHAASIPPEVDRHSTHAMGLAATIELGRALDRLPRRLIVFGIEGRRFDAGIGLTPVVEGAIARALTAILEELRTPAGPGR
jgi:hydrogenase maturation protease